MTKETLLIVDDEEQMRSMIKLYLQSDFTIIEASNGKEALHMVFEKNIDIILLDIMMPGMDGLTTCQRIKAVSPDLPIILLTALNETKQKVEGLSIGADDYIVKPFEPDELLARIQVQLRRQNKDKKSFNSNTKLVFENLIIDAGAREVTVGKEKLKCTPKEFDLLFLLASHPNRVYTREQLLDKIWSFDDVVDMRTVDSHVRYIRDKFKKSALSYQPIQTIWGVGYKFIPGDNNENK
ncbi:response regulator transcription factor [Saliterribacillus persicus]|uniref:Two-component system response regulator ResD n=1 Tax=Saliterribacillus persicus TaxID=930114 RepID=A0A368XR47_9BACI|nr:response regulator transcription factor [Saliterribacillus persicus]RCW69626.1 two-component system response regulator ResD [Saliterribacillus persicus]